MLKLKSSKGFTLIELLVVVIIVAVLAAVGVPLLSANVGRARTSEAEAGLGTIRTALRSFRAERATYVGATFASIGLNLTTGNVTDGDLDGRFFDDTDYSLTAQPLTATTFCVSAVGNSGADTAPRASQVAGVSRSMNEKGDIFSDASCTLANLLN